MLHAYILGEYDTDPRITHEIEIRWPTHTVPPPIVLPPGSFLTFEDQKEIPEEMLGTWKIVEICSYPDYRGDGISSLCYLVKRGPR